MRTQTLSTFDIARMLDLSPGTVANWIDCGRLKAFTTLGGHRRVKREDLVAFLKENELPLPAALEDAGRTWILAVDDDERFLKMLARALKQKGFDVATAMSGFEAGAEFQARHYDIVVLDIVMPVLDGYDTCRTIKARGGGTAVIAITGYDSPEARKKAAAAGADAYLTKPFRMEKLFAEIERLLGGKTERNGTAKNTQADARR